MKNLLLFLFLLVPQLSLAQVHVIAADTNVGFRDMGYDPSTGQVGIVGYEVSGSTKIAKVFGINSTNDGFTSTTLVGLGTGTQVFGISSDASRLAGISKSPGSVGAGEGTTWLRSAPSSPVGIGFLVGNTKTSTAFAAWKNGVVGECSGGDSACKWSTTTAVTALPNGGGLGVAFDVSADGLTAVGFFSDSICQGNACYWDTTNAHKLQDPYNVDSIAYSISPSGSYIGGYVGEFDQFDNDYINAAVWDSNKNLILLKDSNGNRFEGKVLDVSDLGYAVGETRDGKGFIWHPDFDEPKIFEDWLVERQADYSPTIISKGVEAVSEDRINGKLRFALSDYEAAGASFYVEVDAPEIIEEPQKYALWNSFLGMWNILELVNDTDSTQTVDVKLYNINGELKDSKRFTLSAGEQRDELIHNYVGVQESLPGGSYGIITIDGKVTGRLTYYKFLGFNNFDFAYSIPLLTPSTGVTSVGFNTMEPSGVPVSNWFSLVNLANVPKTFNIKKYNQSGGLLSNQDYTLPAQSRQDIDGGHIVPGRRNVGLMTVTPTDSSAPYIAQLVRYGDRSAATQDFAFPLLAKTATDSVIFTPLTTLNSADNWLEIANPSETKANVIVKLYKSDGTLVTENHKIEPHSQVHIFTNSTIGAENTGYAEIDSDVPIISQSMVYEYLKTGGALLSMYGLQASNSYPKIASTSYNLNIGMDNFLRLNNLTDTTVNFVLKISSPSPSALGSTLNISLSPRQSKNLNLKDTTTYGTAIDTYGRVSVSSSANKQIQAYVLRKHYDSNNILDFAAPTVAQ